MTTNTTNSADAATLTYLEALGSALWRHSSEAEKHSMKSEEHMSDAVKHMQASMFHLGEANAIRTQIGEAALKIADSIKTEKIEVNDA